MQTTGTAGGYDCPARDGKKSFRRAAFVRAATFTPSGDAFSRRRAYDGGKNVGQAVFFSTRVLSGKASKADKNPVHETAFYVNLTMMLIKNNFSGKLEKEI
ncbi:hypothetical protein [Pyramidobacter piscolens]|uniref:hypothetical protein n=1 Tax=Pyramidobacter piscolens TaxID=638849 RepID=UPI002AB0DA2A|nr:hypothetical protein [Pyramidobacter piscolens]